MYEPRDRTHPQHKETTLVWKLLECSLLIPIVILPYNTLSTGFLSLVGRYTLGDKLQDVAATDHSVCTGRVNSCSNTLGLHVAATNRFACTGEFVWKSLSLQQNFDVATSRKKSNQTEFVRLVAATKFFCSHKNLHKNSPVHSERFVAATCRLVHVPICGWNPLAPVVQTLDSAIHRINHYPADKCYGNQLRYPLDSDLSGG